MIKNIAGYKGYSVSSKGEIFSDKVGKMKLQKNIDGYNVVNLFRDGKYYHKRVARIVAEAFLPNPHMLPVVNHIDHTRVNDDVENLEWCTFKENTMQSSQKHPERWLHRAEINEETARKICEMIQEGQRNLEISESLGVAVDTIKHIRSGKTWTSISKDYKLLKSKRAISEETVRWICNQILSGKKNKEIVEVSNNDRVTTHIVKAIRSKRTWSHISNKYF